MDIPEVVLRFLASEAFEMPSERPEPGCRPFITISRQAGAGGRSLAQALLAHFASRTDPLLSGWQSADREVCERLASDPRLGVSMQALLDERFRGHLEDYLAQAISGSAPQIKVHRAIFSTMRSLAAVGRVILVGRAGFMATRGYTGGVHVRLVGSRASRIERVVMRERLSREEARTWVDRQDRERQALVQEYFGVSSNDPAYFEATFNTDHMGFDAIAEAATALVLSRARTPRTLEATLGEG